MSKNDRSFMGLLKGQALVTFVLALIVFLISVTAIISFSRGYMIKNLLNQAAREGVRFAATLPEVENKKDEVVDVVIARLATASIVPQDVIVNTDGYEDGEPIKVTVKYKFKPFLSKLGFAKDGVAVSGMAVMHYEGARTLGDSGYVPKSKDSAPQEPDEDLLDGSSTPQNPEEEGEKWETVSGEEEEDVKIENLDDDEDEEVSEDEEEVMDDEVVSEDEEDEQEGAEEESKDEDAANMEPVARINATPKSGEAPLTVELDALQSVDPDGYIETYFWDIGGLDLNSYDKQLEVEYKQAGEYTVTLTVIDNEGAMNIAKEIISVEAMEPEEEEESDGADQTASGNQRPLAKIVERSQPPYHPGDAIDLDGTASIDPDGEIVAYYWSFDSTEADPAPIGAGEPGQYTATLTVRDNEGAKDSETIIIQVLAADNEAPSACFGYQPRDADEDTVIEFDASCSDDDKEIVEFRWSGAFNATGETVSKKLSAGAHNVKLTVTDSDGATDSVTKKVDVDAIPRISPE